MVNPPPHSYKERNHKKITSQARKAIRDKTTVKGIKGISPLTHHVDLVECIPVDYMHTVLEGTVRHLLKLWFDSRHHHEPYYIGNKVKGIDQVLLLQTPPNEFSRLQEA